MDEPQTALEVLKWHKEMLEQGVKDAREEIERQMKWYAIVFGIAVTIAGGLITFAGFLGYKDAVDRAVVTVNKTLTEEVKGRIVDDTTAELEKTVQADISKQALTLVSRKIDTMLADADRRYVKVNGEYLLHTGGWYLNLVKDSARSLTKADNGDQTFTLTPK
jgi:hypothetical protein